MSRSDPDDPTAERRDAARLAALVVWAALCPPAAVCAPPLFRVEGAPRPTDVMDVEAFAAYLAEQPTPLRLSAAPTADDRTAAVRVQPIVDAGPEREEWVRHSAAAPAPGPIRESAPRSAGALVLAGARRARVGWGAQARLWREYWLDVPYCAAHDAADAEWTAQKRLPPGWLAGATDVIAFGRATERGGSIAFCLDANESLAEPTSGAPAA